MAVTLAVLEGNAPALPLEVPLGNPAAVLVEVLLDGCAEDELDDAAVRVRLGARFSTELVGMTGVEVEVGGVGVADSVNVLPTRPKPKSERSLPPTPPRNWGAAIVLDRLARIATVRIAKSMSVGASLFMCW